MHLINYIVVLKCTEYTRLNMGQSAWKEMDMFSSSETVSRWFSEGLPFAIFLKDCDWNALKHVTTYSANTCICKKYILHNYILQNIVLYNIRKQITIYIITQYVDMTTHQLSINSNRFKLSTSKHPQKHPPCRPLPQLPSGSKWPIAVGGP